MNFKSVIFVCVLSLVSWQAYAHVSVANGPHFSGKRSVITLNVPHGCEGSDTYRIEVDLPEGLTGTRPMDNSFGKATIEKDNEDNVVKLIWTKIDGALLDDDTHLYQVTFRGMLEINPFTTAYFPTVQFCRSSDGVESTNEWVGISAGHNHGGGAETKPAPAMMVYPERYVGWNVYTIDEHVHDLSVFADAEIVWVGNSAYSANPNTRAQIENDASVDLLDAIHPGTEVWVKY